MRGVYTPPIIREYIEHTQYKNQEGGWPLGLETNSHHDTSSKTDNADEHANKAPWTLKDEAQEQENKQNTACKEEACTILGTRRVLNKLIGSLFLAVGFTDAGQTSK